MTSSFRLLAVLSLLSLYASACSTGSGAGAAAPAAASAAAPAFKVTERAEPGPITALAYRAPILYAGSSQGLRRWDVTTDEYEVLGADAGLLGHAVTAVGVDGQKNVWVATDGGVGRFVPAGEGEGKGGWTYKRMGG